MMKTTSACILITLFFACSNREKKNDQRTETPPVAEIPKNKNSADAKVLDTQSHIGIRSFAEINTTFAALTGTIPDNATGNQYGLVRFTLPSESNDIRTFNASHQAAIIKLASEYCRQYVASEGFKASMTALGLTFNREAFMANVEAQKKLGRFFAEKFWLLASGESDFSVAEQEAVTLLQQFSQNQNFNVNNAPFGICTAVLASFPTLEK